MNTKFRTTNIHKSLWQVCLLVILVMVLAACTPAANATPEPTMLPALTATVAPAATATLEAKAPATEATINWATDPKYGKILVDDKGMTLYIYTKDEPNKSNCNDACLKNWPPLLTQGSPKLGDGIDASLIGTTDLANGTKIVTFNKMPLYYWVKDTKSGDTTGIGVGNVWYVVSPAGKAVGMEASINIANDPKYGKILVDGNGMTLYMYTKDEANKSNCSAGCLKAWPPLLTYGAPKLGDGVDTSLMGTADLADGSKIVTYNKMPLYYWAKDTKPGDTTGVGVSNVWYVVSNDGKVVGQDVTLNIATDPKLGKILVDGNGMTLYIYTKDTADKSTCNAGCQANWPPFVTSGKPTAGAGVDDSLIGTTTLDDGRLIVTYNKMPLYYFMKDTKPGDATGEGVGNVWYTITPDGKIVNGAPNRIINLPSSPIST